MKKSKKTQRKLRLSTETLRVIDQPDLEKAAGARPAEETVVPTFCITYFLYCD